MNFKVLATLVALTLAQTGVKAMPQAVTSELTGIGSATQSGAIPVESRSAPHGPHSRSFSFGGVHSYGPHSSAGDAQPTGSHSHGPGFPGFPSVSGSTRHGQPTHIRSGAYGNWPHSAAMSGSAGHPFPSQGVPGNHGSHGSVTSSGGPAPSCEPAVSSASAAPIPPISSAADPSTPTSTPTSSSALDNASATRTGTKDYAIPSVTAFSAGSEASATPTDAEEC